MLNIPSLLEEYKSLWNTMEIRKEHISDIRIAASNILQPARLKRYKFVQDRTGIPWMVIACIHNLEASLSFQCHLHNGDPLSSCTVNVPAGYPRNGSPPFSWEESAINALEMKGANNNCWSIPECLFYFEQYNGWGYRNGKGRDTTPPNSSPYLWSFTNHYEKGKYVGDHIFKKEAVSSQMGAAALLSSLIEMTNQEPSDNVAIRNSSEYDFPLTRRGNRGKYVAKLQILLRDMGFNPSEVDGIFGKQTEASVRDFQLSKKLIVDGIVGSKTWGALLSPPEKTIICSSQALTHLREYFVKFASAEASKQRKYAPNNEIDHLVLNPLRPILKELGHLSRNDNDSFFNWCAAWVTYICRCQGIKIPDRYGDFWASIAKVDAWRDMAMDTGSWFRTGSRIPLPGDIVVYNWDDDSDTDHIGILKEYDGANGVVIACEGNKRNCEAIAYRKLNDIEGFIDLEILNSKIS